MAQLWSDPGRQWGEVRFIMGRECDNEKDTPKINLAFTLLN
jgi:hypothetical protein